MTISTNARLFVIPAASTAMVVGLLGLVIYFPQFDAGTAEIMQVRTVEMAAPPPPPPPAMEPPKQQQTAASMQLNIAGEGVTIAFSEPQIGKDLELSELPEVDLLDQTHAMLDSLQMDWHAFGLSDLDEVPRLLTQLSIDFPRALKRQGVKLAEIELDVMIDEQGKVVLREIIHNEHEELVPTIQNLVKRARFTVPKKDGVAVRASFYWPLEFADT